MSTPGLVIAALALLAGLTACSGGEDDSAGPAPSCDLLRVDDVRRATGLEVELTERSGSGGTTECAYAEPGAEAMEPPVAAVLLAGSGVPLDDLAERVRGGSAEETSSEEVDLDGAERAVVLTDSSFGFDSVFVLAEGPDGSYAVGGSGASPEAERQMGLDLMTLLLGGQVEDKAVIGEAQHPCEVLTGPEVSAVVDGDVTAERTPDVDGLCTYDGEDLYVSLLSFGRDAPIDVLVAMQEDDGAKVTPFEADGYDKAVLVQPADDPASLEVYLVTPADSYQLGVRSDGYDESARIARGLLPRVLRD